MRTIIWSKYTSPDALIAKSVALLVILKEQLTLLALLFTNLEPQWKVINSPVIVFWAI